MTEWSTPPPEGDLESPLLTDEVSRQWFRRYNPDECIYRDQVLPTHNFGAGNVYRACIRCTKPKPKPIRTVPVIGDQL